MEHVEIFVMSMAPSLSLPCILRIMLLEGAVGVHISAPHFQMWEQPGKGRSNQTTGIALVPRVGSIPHSQQNTVMGLLKCEWVSKHLENLILGGRR